VGYLEMWAVKDDRSGCDLIIGYAPIAFMLTMHCMWPLIVVSDHAAQSMWSGINLALSAVNLGDAAGDMLPKENLAEIYALAAMTIRLFFPVRCRFLAVCT
jgi:hypothetical protein